LSTASLTTEASNKEEASKGDLNPRHHGLLSGTLKITAGCSSISRLVSGLSNFHRAATVANRATVNKGDTVVSREDTADNKEAMADNKKDMVDSKVAMEASRAITVVDTEPHLKSSTRAMLVEIQLLELAPD
jgi:hypothetical protein